MTPVGRSAGLEKIRGLESALKIAQDVIEGLRHENVSLKEEKAGIAGEFKQWQRSLKNIA